MGREWGKAGGVGPGERTGWGVRVIAVSFAKSRCFKNCGLAGSECRMGAGNDDRRQASGEWAGARRVGRAGAARVQRERPPCVLERSP